MMDELNPEVRMYLDETKKVLKAHFLALGEEKSAFELEWEEKVEAFPKETHARRRRASGRTKRACPNTITGHIGI